MALIDIIEGPDFYEPSYQNSIAWNVIGTNSNLDNYKYIFEVYTGEEYDNINTYQTTVTTYPRTGGNCIFSPHYVLKDVVTYNITPFIEDFVQATQSLSFYNIRFGEQYNPGLTFGDTNFISGVVGLVFDSVVDIRPGDIITIDKDDISINEYYNGTASVTGTQSGGTIGGNPAVMTVITDIPWGSNTPLEPGDIINLVRRNIETSGKCCVFNGTRQYEEINRDFESEFVIDNATASYEKFLTSYENEKPIYFKNGEYGEWETLSFIAATSSVEEYEPYSTFVGPTEIANWGLRVNTFDGGVLQNTELILFDPNEAEGTIRFDVGCGTNNLATYSIIDDDTDNYECYLEGAGPNVVDNPLFTTPGGGSWSVNTVTAGATISFIGTGVLYSATPLSTLNGAILEQTGVLTIGEEYTVVISFAVLSGFEPVTLLVGDSVNQYTVSNNINGVFNITFTAASTDFWIVFNSFSGVNAQAASLGACFVNEGRFRISEKREFKIERQCREYDLVRLAFLNKLGGIDYWTFNLVSKFRSSIQRETIQRVLQYNYSLGDRGLEVVGQKISEEWEVNTDYLNDDEALFIRELVESPEVYMVDGNDLLPLIITDNNWELKSTLNDQLVQYSIKFRKAYDIISNV